MTVAPVEVVEETTQTTDGDDGETFTHIVNPQMNPHIFLPGMTSRQMVKIAGEYGIEIVALCGYKWVPKKNPDLYPACKACFEEAGRIIRETEG